VGYHEGELMPQFALGNQYQAHYNGRSFTKPISAIHRIEKIREKPLDSGE
jgi:hypothetical protein